MSKRRVDTDAVRDVIEFSRARHEMIANLEVTFDLTWTIKSKKMGKSCKGDAHLIKVGSPAVTYYKFQ